MYKDYTATCIKCIISINKNCCKLNNPILNKKFSKLTTNPHCLLALLQVNLALSHTIYSLVSFEFHKRPRHQTKQSGHLNVILSFDPPPHQETVCDQICMLKLMSYAGESISVFISDQEILPNQFLKLNKIFILLRVGYEK